MARFGIKPMMTAFDKKPDARSKRTRIRIPQPVTRPYSIHARDLINDELLGQSQWWATVHKRGIRRPEVGIDPLEMRAVPHSEVRGTLPERILYKYLVERMHMMPGVDFTFQTSLVGGRIVLGGIVADFMFPLLRIVIQIQGPTHRDFLRMRKDQEQTAILEDFGYKVYGIDDSTVYNAPLFEQTVRRIFDLWGSEYAEVG